MELSQVVEIGKELFYTAMLLALPSLAISLIVGLIISIFQAITSIQEQTMTFAPRVFAVGLVIVFTMAWALQVAVHFTMRMMSVGLEAVRP